MTMEPYTTITGEIPEGGVSPVSYEIQRSRFLAYAIHAEDEEEVRPWLQTIKKTHYEARHIPYAMVFGERADRQRSSDDGEPGGTAGSPILEAVKARGVTNAAVAVVRYFGGIKLGAGGLIRAYAHAAGLGIDAAAKVRMTPLHTMYVQIDYDLLAAVERCVRDAALQTEEADYVDKVTLALLIPTGDIELHQRALTDLTAGRARYRLGEQKYVAVPLA
ncbi:MAG: IMPACT family protein [Centipeda sp. (in: firmicutes)]